ncbi:MAG: class III extradiol ring-cleavage dioxygenase [Porticoccaceae bacterium]|nr:class III extradiol ring-cleavage dioxygenase [Porticoccaceae bacterium]MEA3299392.1 class III extradiol ring-cleavage dioxygenase [Pseudomonadota bacterium]HLS98549.1 class III extradiol ring-cleavage dioxygenase [Porticoccaceae bacterium]
MPTPSPQPVLFLSHGGGPLPLLGDPGHREMVDFLDGLRPALGRPRAILVASAHWEAPRPTLTGNPNPPLFYDYYGFPEASYQIRYPAPGDPALAARIADLLQSRGFDAAIDPDRGFDHGLFVPMKLLFPGADIPCVQLSLLSSLDPAAHLALGEALAPLREEGVLVIGSGFSFHNMKAFFSPASAGPDAANGAFEDWLADSLGNPALSATERRQRLLDWHRAPGARHCHPREEHLLPLHVCLGAAGGAPGRHFAMAILRKRASAFLW